MEVTCEATQSSDTQIRVAALQCLVKIMTHYYQYMETYMGPALFAVSISGSLPGCVLQVWTLFLESIGVDQGSQVCPVMVRLNVSLFIRSVSSWFYIMVQ